MAKINYLVLWIAAGMHHVHYLVALILPLRCARWQCTKSSGPMLCRTNGMLHWPRRDHDHVLVGPVARRCCHVAQDVLGGSCAWHCQTKCRTVLQDHLAGPFFVQIHAASLDRIMLHCQSCQVAMLRVHVASPCCKSNGFCHVANPMQDHGVL